MAEAATEFPRFDLALHRWTGSLSWMAALGKTAAAFLAGYSASVQDVRSDDYMIDSPSRLYSHDWTKPKATFARDRIEDVVELTVTWPDEAYSLAACTLCPTSSSKSSLKCRRAA
jgi:hypothetical protein